MHRQQRKKCRKMSSILGPAVRAHKACAWLVKLIIRLATCICHTDSNELAVSHTSSSSSLSCLPPGTTAPSSSSPTLFSPSPLSSSSPSPSPLPPQAPSPSPSPPPPLPLLTCDWRRRACSMYKLYSTLSQD